jgi:hypothetical protein
MILRHLKLQHPKRCSLLRALCEVGLLLYLVTNSREQRPSLQADSWSTIQGNPHKLRGPNLNYSFHRRMTIGLILITTSPVRNLPLCFFKIHCNIIPSTSRFYKCFFPSGFTTKTVDQGCPTFLARGSNRYCGLLCGPQV